jgi:hypothetical protein
MVIEPSEGVRGIMKNVRYETLQQQKRQYPGDKLSISTETVTLKNCMESQLNLIGFTNIQVSLLEMVMESVLGVPQ